MNKHRFGGVIGGNMSAIKTGVKIIDDFHAEVTLSNGAVYEMHAPKGQSLNGLSMDLVRAKVTEQIRPLYARICVPPVTKKQFDNMELGDISLLNAALDFFYADPIGKAAIKEMWDEFHALDSEATTAGDSVPTGLENSTTPEPASLPSETISPT